MNQNENFHTLLEPMLFETGPDEGTHYLLPAGTTLYFDKSFPEGHIRYKTYLNYKGSPLPLEKSEKEGFIAPSWIYRIEKNEVEKLMGTYPLSKGDLKRILRANSFSRAELIEIINSYKSE